MEVALRAVDVNGTMVIGEGAESEVEALWVGQKVGNGDGPAMDVAARAIEGRRLLAVGLPNAISVIVMSDSGSMYRNPAGMRYMNKIAVGPEAKGAVDLDQTAEWNVKNIAKAKHIDVREVTIVVLDRPRNQQLIREIRQTGARLHLISDGDLNGALLAALPNTGVDAMMGIGGADEAVLTAGLFKCLDGEIICRLYPHNTATRQQALNLGISLQQVYGIHDLLNGENVFASVTGITDGERIEGLRYTELGVYTHSLIMRSRSGTIRDVRARHRLDKLMNFSEIDFISIPDELVH
jgi:fructose-1,6-bisphosphatase II